MAEQQSSVGGGDGAGPTLYVVIAATPEWGVGNKGSVPWVLASELRRSQALTTVTSSPMLRNAIVVGSKTYLRMPEPRTFANRVGVVLSRSSSFRKDHDVPSDIVVASSLDDALAQLRRLEGKTVERAFVIGGTETFSSALGSQMLQGVYVTRILTADVECDSRVVPFSMQEFSLVEEDAARTEGSWRFKHEHYERRQTETRTVRTTTTTTTTTTNTTNSASSRGDANSKDGDGGAQTNSGGAPAATTTSSGKQRRPHKPRSPRTSRPGRRRQRTAQSRSRSPRTRTSPRPRRRRGQKKEPKLMGPLQPVVPRQRVVQDTPGPGAYEVEASIGRQASSFRPTSSQWSFGSAPRGAYHRQYLNKQLQEGVLNTNTKDVDFMKGRGTRSVSTSRKLPSYSFGRAARDKYHKEYLNKEMAKGLHLETTKDVDYIQVSSTGPQALSTKQNLPSYSFGRAPRDRYHKEYLNKEMAKGVQLQTTRNVDYMASSDSTLNLGTYSHAAKHNNSPRPTFGKVPRDQYERQFFGKDYQGRMVKADPNMATVELPATGRQVQSKKKTAPSYGFGTGSRDRRARLAMVKSVPQQAVSPRMTSAGAGPRLSPRVTREQARAEVKRSEASKSSYKANEIRQSRGTSLRQQRVQRRSSRGRKVTSSTRVFQQSSSTKHQVVTESSNRQSSALVV